MGTKELDVQRSQLAVPTRDAVAIGLTVAALLGAVALRWLDLGKPSLWWDEGFTAFASSLSPAYIVRFAQSDNNPPVYYLLQHYWGAIFGNSEFALRALSAFFGTLSLPVFYFLAKRVLQDSFAAVLAMWLFAFSLVQVWYSREARSYEVASFLALVALYALVLFLERRSVLLFATIVLCVTASLYMHNMMLFYLVALNATWLTYPSTRSWTQRIGEVFVADVLTFILYLPWAVNLVTQAAAVRGNLWWVPRPTLSTLLGTLRLMAGLDTSYLPALAGRLLPLSPRTAWLGVLAGSNILCAGLLAAGLWRVSKTDRSKNVSLLLYCLLPILMVFVISQKMEPVYIDRVFTTSSAIVPLVFAFPLTVQRRQKERLFYIFLGTVLAAATAFSAFGYLREQQKEDWRGATGSLLKVPEPNRLIVFVPPAGEFLFDYYSRRLSVVSSTAKVGLPAGFYEEFPPPKGRVIVASDINRLKLAVESKEYSELDLVLTHGVDPHELVLDYLDRVFIPKEEQEFYQIRIVRFVAPPPQESVGDDYARENLEVNRK